MDIREQIAEICGGSVVTNPYVRADQILAIKVGEDKICGCVEEPDDVRWACTVCGGGSQIPAKTIGECIEGV